MRFPRTFIDEVRRNADPLTIIGDVVALKRRGSRWVGLCPFHQEKTPSFTVSDEGLWHCFGCGVGGDLFRFVQEYEGVGFVEAARSIAERCGVVVPEPQADAAAGPQAPRIERPRLLEALQAAAGFYRQRLRDEAGQRARRFLADRGFSDDVVEEFGLGYAPEGWEALGGHLQGRGFTERELEEAGLVKRRDSGGVYDRLRDRIVFPIRDLRGRTIAFGGRVIDEGEPKYLNSPETPVFHKGRTLYGLREARDAVVEKGFALLVEGYFDLLACAQYGFRNAVAPLGTSFSDEHARLLARFTRKAVIGFDGDTAGLTAAERTAGIFLSEGFQVNVVCLPAGHDPDSFLRDGGAEAFREALRASQPALEFLVRRSGERVDLSTPHGKAEALGALLEFVAPIADRVERAEWIGRLAERLHLDPHLVEQAADDVGRRRRGGGRGDGGRAAQVRRDGRASGDTGRAWRRRLEDPPLSERTLLRAVVLHPEWRAPLVDLCGLEAIRDARIRALLMAMQACEQEGVAPQPGALLDRCDVEGADALLSRVLVAAGDDEPEIDWDTAYGCSLGIHDDSLRRRLKAMQKEIEEALAAGDDRRLHELKREKVSLAQRIQSLAAH